MKADRFTRGNMLPPSEAGFTGSRYSGDQAIPRNLLLAYKHIFGIYESNKNQGKNKYTETAHLKSPLADKINLLVREIRKFSHMRHQYILVLSTQQAIDNLIEAMQDGAADNKLAVTILEGIYGQTRTRKYRVAAPVVF
ncbi:hypothetical protein PG997_011720 [Apiospora hydei]|uniref:Uncharacterized protein n=1 Tax=Apiospora hydei TaxID=1337664 RepID=A0ABR1V1E1_9PEZI